eukprot:CAMPEP_0201569330 /NCGR_PEP_ID=MMETSP0190_2-20130828/10961_1 /ASSEMBLY_ACC=CAM_ASM_000263 /TAXON_ID=37353 /ORGANISM="Rosalina sp." /LENGTH=325 /DNA_ID=CAMNT_0047991533 /DNA_START=157 /DNA_END=1135 /DNA_ORIENTATION=-
MSTTTTTTKLSFNSIPMPSIHNLSSFSTQMPEMHLADESIKELSPELIDIDTESATLCSAQQPPLLCPGLIRNCPVPPPIPMQWQLTVPSESELEDYNIGSISSMDRDREIVLSPDDNNSESNFSFLPQIHQLSNSSSYHSNHSAHSSMSSLSMTSLHSLSSYNPSSSCSTTTNTEWISNEYDNNYQPHHPQHQQMMPALSLIPSISGHTPEINTTNTSTNNTTVSTTKITKSDDNNETNKFHTNKDMIYDALCQFEDGSMSQMISAVDDDDTNNDADDHSQSANTPKSPSQCAISTKYETKHQHLMNGFIRDLKKKSNKLYQMI